MCNTISLINVRTVHMCLFPGYEINAFQVAFHNITMAVVAFNRTSVLLNGRLYTCVKHT